MCVEEDNRFVNASGLDYDFRCALIIEFKVGAAYVAFHLLLSCFFGANKRTNFRQFGG